MILEVNIKGTNLKDNDMDMGNFVIKMVDIIKDSGNLIKWVVLLSYIIKMEI